MVTVSPGAAAWTADPAGATVAEPVPAPAVSTETAAAAVATSARTGKRVRAGWGIMGRQRSAALTPRWTAPHAAWPARSHPCRFGQRTRRAGPQGQKGATG